MFAVVPFEYAESSRRIPVSVKRAKTRRENMIVNTSNSVNGDAMFPQLRVDRKQGTVTYFPTKVTIPLHALNSNYSRAPTRVG